MNSVEAKFSEYVTSVGKIQDEIVQLIDQAHVEPKFDDSELKRRIDALEKQIKMRPQSTVSSNAEEGPVENLITPKSYVKPYVKIPDIKEEPQKPPHIMIPKPAKEEKDDSETEDNPKPDFITDEVHEVKEPKEPKAHKFGTKQKQKAKAKTSL